MSQLKKYREYLILFYKYLKNKQIEEASSLIPAIKNIENKIIKENLIHSNIVDKENIKYILRIKRIIHNIEKKIIEYKVQLNKNKDVNLKEEIDILIKKFLLEKGIL